MERTSSRVSFGEWLKRRRKAAGLTQDQLALEISCSTSALKKIEEEQRRPSAQIATRLAEIFHIPQSERNDFLRFARGDWQFAPGEGMQAAPWVGQAAARRSNLPAPLTALIGRETELAHLREYLTDPDKRLVTLTGPPGIGKTRLSLEAAHAGLRDFPDGVVFVPLAPLEDSSLLAVTVIRSLGFVDAGSEAPAERLKEGIGGKHLLLVLDNLEHLIEAAASLVADLLANCPRLKVLATCREPLRIAGEWLYPVPALSFPGTFHSRPMEKEEWGEFAALKLFAERARAVRPEFTLNTENVGAVAAICAHLAGLPLAIELIAARVRLMTPGVLLEQLSGQFMLQADGMRTGPARQRTLQSAIAWSYDLLTGDEQSLFSQLSVFSGGFTLDALESVVRLTSLATVQDVLTRLVDRSLVVVESREAMRYDLLEPIRQFALEKLESVDNAKLLRDRHLEHFLKFAAEAEPRFYGSGQRYWTEWLELEHDNLRAALTWSLESAQFKAGLQMAGNLATFWRSNGHLSEGSQWLEKVLMADDGSPTAERAKALRCSSAISTRLGDYPRAKDLAVSSVNLYRELGDGPGAGLALLDLGAAFHHEGNGEQALEFLDEGLSVLRSSGDLRGVASAQVWLGDTWFRLGDIARAASHWEESLYLSRELGDSYILAWSLGGLGDVARLRGDYELAVERLTESLTVYRESGNKSEPPYTLEALGSIAAARGQAQRAAHLWGMAAAWREAINEPPPKSYEVDYARSLAQARAELDETAFAEAWAEGHAMTMQQAIAYALEE